MREASSVAELWFARSLPKRSPSSLVVKKGSFVFLREHLGNRQEQQQRNFVSDTRNQITAHHRKISTKSINSYKTYKFLCLVTRETRKLYQTQKFAKSRKICFPRFRVLFSPTVIVDESGLHKLRRLVLLFSQCFTKRVFSVLPQDCDIVFVSRTDLSKSPCCGTTKSLCYQS